MNHIEHKSTMILNGAAKGGINTTDEAVTMSIQGQINHWYLVRTLWIKAGSWWEYILTHSVPKPKRVISAILLSAFPAVVSIMILSFLVIVVNLKGKIPFLYTTWSISGFNFFHSRRLAHIMGMHTECHGRQESKIIAKHFLWTKNKPKYGRF